MYLYTNAIFSSSALATVPFINNKSIALDGVSDYVDCGNISELNNASAFTFSGWYKQTTIDQFDALMEYFIDLNNSFGVYTFTDGNMYLQFQKSTNNLYGYFDYSTLISAGAWFNIVIVYNGSGLTNADKLKCYIDGTLVTLSFSGTQPTTTPAGINEFKIGRNDEYGVNWLGNIDEVALWDTDESANISTIYNSGVPNDISSLSPLSWWRCGEGDTSPTISDNGSGGNDGTMVSFTTFSTDVPLFDNKSFEYDGVNDYIDLGDLSALSGATEFSVSLWFYATTTSNKLILDLKDGSSRIAIQRFDSNKIYLYINGVSGLFTVSTVNNNWYNLSYTFNGSGATNSDKLKLYIDSVEVTATSYSSSVPTSLGVLTSSMLSVLGGLFNGTFTFLGNIDEPAVFDYELTSTQVSTIYGSGVPTSISSLSPVNHWRAENSTWNGSVWTVTDNGSGGNNGTSSGMTLSSRTSDVPT